MLRLLAKILLESPSFPPLRLDQLY